MFPFEGVKNATNLQDLWEDEDLRILVYVLSSTIVMILLIWCTMCLVSILVDFSFSAGSLNLRIMERKSRY